MFKMFVNCLFLVLLMSAEYVSSNAKVCYLLSDIVIAVDTTSTPNPSDFNTVKSEVNKIVETFTVGQTNTRLALISIGDTANVVVNFNAVNSLSDFTRAVNSLTHSTATADLSQGIKLSTDSVFNSARPKATKILILVKDRRTAGYEVYDKNVLTKVTSEAKRVKNLMATINVVGVGALWSTVELEAIYGSDYFMFKGKDKALASIKNLSSKYCEPDCPLKGTKTAEKQGLCYASSRHKIHSRVLLANNAAGVEVCRKEIVRQFESCTDQNKQCNNFVGERLVGQCDATTDKIKVDVTLDYFVSKEQSCRKLTKSKSVKCSKVDECPQQVADIIFVLDRSGSIGTNLTKVLNATAQMVDYLNIGKDNVVVGVFLYSTYTSQVIKHGEIHDKQLLINKIQAISNDALGQTRTHTALAEARGALFKSSRNDVSKFIILITDGKSDIPAETLEETKLIKDNKIDLYVVGVKGANRSEIERMTAPESDEKMIILKEFSDLEPWSRTFSKNLCIKLSPPAIELCRDNVFVQSVTSCENGLRYVANTQYSFESTGAQKCIKSSTQIESKNCNPTCLSPTDGNEYLDGVTWQSLCYTFKCNSGRATVITSKCMASDGSCKDVNASPFKCLDENNKQTDNCLCVQTSEGPTLAIENV